MADKVADKASIAAAIRIRPIQPDDFSDVRYVHAAAFRSQAYPYYTPEELDAFEQMVRSPGYLDRLMADAILGAWFDHKLIATAAWHASRSNAQVGRISALYVQPLFARVGVGSRMLQAIETAASISNCSLMSVRAPLNSESFFMANDYEISGRGTAPIDQASGLDIVFLRKRLPARKPSSHSVCYN